MIVISPGLAVKTPEIQTALKAGVEVIGDIELFAAQRQSQLWGLQVQMVKYRNYFSL